jgi:hypothetical protein
MGMPGFFADASLRRTSNRYRLAAGISSSRADSSLSMASETTSSPSVGRGMDGLMSCCSWKPWLKPPFVCAERRVSPLDNCGCTYDWCGDPAIVCRGATNAPPE